MGACGDLQRVMEQGSRGQQEGLIIKRFVARVRLPLKGL